MEPPTGQQDLNDALLEQIFAFVCLVEQPRRRSQGLPAYRPNSSIPQVCRRWARVYACSTVLWAQLSLDWAAVVEGFLEQGGAHTLIPRWGYASKWVALRAPYIALLSYTGCAVLGPALEGELFRLSRLAQRLHNVQLHDVVHSADHLLGQLLQCPVLQEIGIHCQRPIEGPIQQLTVSVAALKCVSGLASLRSLALTVDKVLGNTRDIGDALSALTQFRFVGRREAVVLHPEFINTLSNLCHLELGNCRLGQFTPRTAEVLSRLTFLGVTDVLAAKPRKKAGTTLWEGLRYLDSLQQLRVEDQGLAGMPAAALGCTGLRGLTLVRSSAADWPGPNHLVAQPNCLAGLQSLHLEDLRLEQNIHPQFYHGLSSLTKLGWCNIQLVPPDTNPLLMLTQHEAMPVPPELSRLTQLRHLCLEYAQLDQVPAAVQALPCLERLSLEGNSITSLPEGHYLTGIEHLSLAANAVQRLPEGLHVCRSLRTLSLARNPELVLTSGDVEALVASCPQLEMVQLTECNGLVMGHSQLEELEEEGHTLPGGHGLGAEGAPLGGLEDQQLMEQLAAMDEEEEQEEEEIEEILLPEEEEEEGRQLLLRLGASSVPPSAAEAAFQQLQSLHPGLLAWGDDRTAWQ